MRHVADPDARPFRYGVAGRSTGSHAADARRRTATRTRRLRHESRHRHRHARHARAARNRHTPPSPHRHAVDDRRGDRQRVVSRGDRRRGATEHGGARARAVAAWRRGEDVAKRVWHVSIDRARRRGARGNRASERRERGAGTGAPDSARQRAAGSCARHFGERRAGVGRPAVECDSRPSARHRGRPRADRRRGGRDRVGVPRAAPRGRADERRSLREHRSAAPGTHRPRTASVQAGAGCRAGTGSGAGGRRNRWRVGREFHRGARGSYFRRPRCHR